MQIQHIDMSVPVSRDTSEGDGGTSKEPSRADADLEALAQALVHTVQQRRRFAWTEPGRVLQRERFSREIKGIVKRMASATAAMVKERNNREEVRIRIYADTLAMINAVTVAHDVHQDRARLLKRWFWRIAGVFAVGAGCAVAFVFYN